MMQCKFCTNCKNQSSFKSGLVHHTAQSVFHIPGQYTCVMAMQFQKMALIGHSIQPIIFPYNYLYNDQVPMVP